MSADVIVAGGGFGGVSTATLLARKGYRVTLIDRYANYPDELRAEQVVGKQIEEFSKLDLFTELLSSVPVVPNVKTYYRGKQIALLSIPHIGFSYQDIITAGRRGLPSNVNFEIGRIKTVEHDGHHPTVILEDGRRLSCSLVVVATGLNAKLSQRLGAKRKVISPQHSTTIAFDVYSPSYFPKSRCPILCYYGERLEDRLDYLTIFQSRSGLRANLFVYRPLNDPWIARFRAEPSAVMLASLPSIVNQLGAFKVSEVQVRASDLSVLENYLHDGIVYIGDAFQEPCPAAGTGFDRLTNDIKCLLTHVDRWFEHDGFAKTSVAAFYLDPNKRQADRAALDSARFRLGLTTGSSIYWTARRHEQIVRQTVKTQVHHLRDFIRQPRPQLGLLTRRANICHLRHFRALTINGRYPKLPQAGSGDTIRVASCGGQDGTCGSHAD